MFTIIHFITENSAVLSHCILVDVMLLVLALCALYTLFQPMPTEEEMEEWAKVNDVDET